MDSDQPTTTARSPSRQRQNTEVLSPNRRVAALSSAVWSVMCTLQWTFTFICFIVPLFILVLVASVAWNFVGSVSNLVPAALDPLCGVPLIATLPVCQHRATQWVDFPALVDVQTKTFEELLNNVADDDGLSLEVKRTEIAARNLATLIRHSDLKAKDLLLQHISRFIEDAQAASRGLALLDARVKGTVDMIMAVNEYAVREMATLAPGYGRGTTAIAGPSRPPDTRAVVGVFVEVMDVLMSILHVLVLEAETRWKELTALQEKLGALEDIVVREGRIIFVAKHNLRSNILLELWTRLGGNSRELRVFAEQEGVLRNVNLYLQDALAHVVAALQVLQVLSADLEVLRQRASDPVLVGERIPLSIQMESLQRGAERLKEARRVESRRRVQRDGER